MADRRGSVDTKAELVRWLKKHHLDEYHQALEDEGYDDVRDLASLSEDQLGDLTTTWRSGHKIKLQRILREVRLNEAEWELEIERRELAIKQQKLDQGNRSVAEISPVVSKGIDLPHGKRFGCFASHKSEPAQYL